MMTPHEKKQILTLNDTLSKEVQIGSFQINEIVDVMKNRDPSMLGPVSLEMMLKEGKAGALAAMMLEKGRFIVSFRPVEAHRNCTSVAGYFKWRL